VQAYLVTYNNNHLRQLLLNDFSVLAYSFVSSTPRWGPSPLSRHWRSRISSQTCSKLNSDDTVWTWTGCGLL